MNEPEKPCPLIIMVDDDKLILSLVSAILQPEFEVITCETSNAARALIDARPPDLAITDMYMPGDGGGGRELMDWMHINHPNVPIIAVSGGDARTLNQAAATATATPGAVVTLAKPFRAPAVLQAVRQVLSRQKPD